MPVVHDRVLLFDDCDVLVLFAHSTFVDFDAGAVTSFASAMRYGATRCWRRCSWSLLRRSSEGRGRLIVFAWWARDTAKKCVARLKDAPLRSSVDMG